MVERTLVKDQEPQVHTTPVLPTVSSVCFLLHSVNSANKACLCRCLARIRPWECFKQDILRLREGLQGHQCQSQAHSGAIDWIVVP